MDDSLAITRKDYYSGVNKGYVNENFLKKDGFNFDLKGSNITNGEPYYDGFMEIVTLFSKSMSICRMTNRISLSTTSFQRTGQARWRAIWT